MVTLTTESRLEPPAFQDGGQVVKRLFGLFGKGACQELTCLRIQRNLS
jgi:hypothetical protein